MLQAITAHSNEADSHAAGQELGRKIREAFGETTPDAVILFAAPAHDFETLLKALEETCEPACLVGCSSAGEFTDQSQGLGLVCAAAISASDMRFHAISARNLSQDREAAAKHLVNGLQGLENPHYRYRTMLVLHDALAGHADELVTDLAALTGGEYQLFGGGAGGDAQFARRYVFHGTDALEDGMVALEILSERPIGIGVRHGWTPCSNTMRVTEATGNRLHSLNTVPAAEIFEDQAQRTAQQFERGDPLPFFLHNVIGIDTGGGHKLRVPLSVEDDGAVSCATEVPQGALVNLMTVTVQSATDAARESVREAISQLDGREPALAIFFDCVATRMRMGRDFGNELDAIRDELGPDARLAGCNSIGQIASAAGQLNGFHNCTPVVCIIPA